MLGVLRTTEPPVGRERGSLGPHTYPWNTKMALRWVQCGTISVPTWATQQNRPAVGNPNGSYIGNWKPKPSKNHNPLCSHLYFTSIVIICLFLICFVLFVCLFVCSFYLFVCFLFLFMCVLFFVYIFIDIDMFFILFLFCFVFVFLFCFCFVLFLFFKSYYPFLFQCGGGCNPNVLWDSSV